MTQTPVELGQAGCVDEKDVDEIQNICTSPKTVVNQNTCTSLDNG